jgi:hypothetical protein
MANETIIARIQKLFSLSQSDNIHEAEQALKLAMRLMEENQISEAMLDAKRINHEPDESVENWDEPLYANPGTSRSLWRSHLAMVLGEHNACAIWGDGKGSLHIVGRISDVQTMRYLFQYCMNEIERLCGKYKGKGKSWLNNYKIGAVTGIGEKLSEGKQMARNEAIIEHGQDAVSAIVKIDEKAIKTQNWFDNFKANKGLRDKSFGASQHNSDARSAGHNDGKTINLGSGAGLGGSGTKGQLPAAYR